MKKINFIFWSVLCFSIFITLSCSNENSLQKYIVENQNNDAFIAIDIPSSILNLEEDTTAETKEAWSSIKKLNILALKLDDTNKDTYLSEYKKIKNILKNKKFNELIRIKHEGANIIVKYLGNEEAIDEIIVLASDKNKGFVLARVLGKKMNPEKMVNLIKHIKDIDKDNAALSPIKQLLKNLN